MKPLVYLMLGATGSGRREIVADLVDGGLDEGERGLVLLAAGEAPDAHDARLGPVGRWSWADGRIVAPSLADAGRVFLLADGHANPVDQVEAFHSWLATGGGELARILCVVNCRLAAEHKALLVWYDACVHFSDVVLFNRREGVANKWMSELRARYAARFLPCLFEMVKAGRVENPALILEPQARRLSHLFDEEVGWEVTGAGEDAERGAEIEAHPEIDPYLERRPGGRRVKELPDVRDFLPPG